MGTIGTTEFSVYDAKTHLSELIAQAEAGQDVVITRHGKPVARLTAIHAETVSRAPGAWAGQVWMSDDFDEFTEQDAHDWYDGDVFPA